MTPQSDLTAERFRLVSALASMTVLETCPKERRRNLDLIVLLSHGGDHVKGYIREASDRLIDWTDRS